MVRSSNHDAAGPLSGERVLVVEDDVIITVDLESVLLAAGAEIAGFGRTVTDALALVDGDQITAAILDIRLGRETVAPVARQLAERGIPFIFYSAQVDIDWIRAEWPLCKFIPKPARPRTIVNAIAAAVREQSPPS
jgi:DNA-binding NtrC family response regulator